MMMPCNMYSSLKMWLLLLLLPWNPVAHGRNQAERLPQMETMFKGPSVDERVEWSQNSTLHTTTSVSPTRPLPPPLQLRGSVLYRAHAVIAVNKLHHFNILSRLNFNCVETMMF